MARPRQPESKRQWIEAALDALESGGVDAIKVQALARALKVTKGSFYWHFDNRDALLMAILDHWEEEGTRAIIDAIEGQSLSAMDRPRALWSLVNASGRMGAEMAIRDWSRRDQRARTVVERVDRQRLDYVRAIFEALGHDPTQAESRALLSYSLLIGLHFIGTADREVPEQDAIEAAISLLSVPPDHTAS